REGQLMPWVLRLRRKRRIRRRKASAKSRAEFQLYKSEARALVESRLRHFNQHYNFTYNKVFIRNTRSRWGSCSSRGNLGFNYRVVKLSPALLDYIVVHELCHLGEFNHSKAFWSLVAQTSPDAQAWRRQLREIRNG